MKRTELRLSDGRLLVAEIQTDEITIALDEVRLLTLSRPDTWKLVELLDALATQR